MHLRLVSRLPRKRRVRARRIERPSLAIAFARSLALALFIALALLAQVARGQSPPPSTPTTSSATSSKNEPSVGSALRRSADRHALWGSLGIGRASAGMRGGT